MLKILLLMALAVIVWWSWRQRSRAAGDVRPPVAPPPERMVACAHCGVYLPENDGVAGDGRHYCCDAHRRAGESGRP